jgi:hypothetical protein
MDDMNDRIKLAEAMGWQKHDHEEWWQSPTFSRFKTAEHLPDPFTDANDDYAVLEWARGVDGFSNQDHENRWGEFLVAPTDYPALKHKAAYQIGDYARAALKVINNEQ